MLLACGPLLGAAPASEILTEVLRWRAILVDPDAPAADRIAARTALAAAIDPPLAEVLRDPDAPTADDPTLRLACCLGALTLATTEPDQARALGWFRGAHTLARAIGERGIAMHTAEAMAQRLGEQGDFAAAAALLEQTLDDLEDRDRANPQLKDNIPAVLVDLAEVHIGANRFREALHRLEAAEALLDPNLDFHRILRCRMLGLRGQAFLHMGLPDVAAESLTLQMAAGGELLAQDVAGAEVAHQDAVLRSIHLCLATERFARAVALADEALQPARYRALQDSTRQQLLLRKAMALGELGREDASCAAAAEAIVGAQIGQLALAEAVPARLLLVELAIRRDAWSEARQRLDELAALCHADRGDRDPLSGQWVLWDAQRAALRSLVARLAGDHDGASLASLRDDLELNYDRFLAEWRRAGWRSQGTAFLHFGQRSFVIGELIETVLAEQPGADGVDAAFTTLLRAAELATVTRSLGAEVPTLAQIRQTLLQDDEIILAWLITPETLHLFALDRHDLRHARSDIGSRTIAAAAREFQELCFRSPRREAGPEARERRRQRLDELGHQLVRDVFPPAILERLRDARRLTLVGTEMLGLLPMEALPWGDDSRLGREVAIGYLPSIPFGTALCNKPPTARLGVAAPELVLIGLPQPTAAADAPPLLHLPRSAIDRLCHDYADREVLLGADADAAGFARGMQRAARVAQVWTHGTYEPLREFAAGLLVSADAAHPDGHLRYEDILAMQPPHLVVLAACGAAYGPTRRGEDLVGRLDAAFLRAGARCVVLPAADAAEAATLTLLTYFHHRLRGIGDDPAEAMRHARLSLSRTPGHDDPFYDSNMHVVGLAHVPLFDPTELRPHEAPPAHAGGASRHITALAIGCALLGLAALGHAIRKRRSVR